MSRKSRIEPVREFLEEEIVKAKCSQELSVSAEQYALAELYKGFKGVLAKAIELCGQEKPKEVNDGIKT